MEPIHKLITRYGNELYSDDSYIIWSVFRSNIYPFFDYYSLERLIRNL
jgi:hypothetical protein